MSTEGHIKNSKLGPEKQGDSKGLLPQEDKERDRRHHMAEGQLVGRELREGLGGGTNSVMVTFWTADAGYRWLIWTPRDGRQRGGSQGSPGPACIRQVINLKGDTTEKVESRSEEQVQSQVSRNSSD